MFQPIRELVRVRDGSKILQAFQRSKPTLAVNSREVKDFQDIPSPPAWPFLGHLVPFMNHGERLDKYSAGLHKQYGDMVRLKLPGSMGNILLLFNPEDIKSMYTGEERIPKIPG